MCAIFGIHLKNKHKKQVFELFKNYSLELMRHRGPDHCSHVFLEESDLLMGYLRYALRGKEQPVRKEDSLLFFNGEIYNYRELGSKNSDRDVSEGEALLEFLNSNLLGSGFSERLSEKRESEIREFCRNDFSFLERIDGMFAISYFDGRNLHLIRDRWGTRPLYYYNGKDFFVYSSEIKPILKLVGDFEYDTIYLFQYLTFMDAYDDSTIFKNIRQLLPGYVLVYDAYSGTLKKLSRWHRGFSFRDEIKDEEEALFLLEKAFTDSFPELLDTSRTLSSFLSGGIDSTIVASFLKKSCDDTSSFPGFYVLSYVMEDAETNLSEDIYARELEITFEVPWAWKVARSLNASLKVGLQTQEDAASSLDALVWHLEEPRVGISFTNFHAFGDIKKMADVVLTGNGGDELFAGYTWRHGLAFEKDFESKYFKAWEVMLFTDEVKPAFFTDSFMKLVKDLSSEGFFFRKFHQVFQKTPLKTILAFDIETFLASLLLVDDKLSMAYPVEPRHPFLSLPVLEVALNISDELRVRKSSDGFFFKYLLRRFVETKVNPDVAFREKTGFAPPLASWFRSSSFLKVYEDRLFNRVSPIYFIFKREAVENVIRVHLSGARDYSRRIWAFHYLDSLFSQIESGSFFQKESFVETRFGQF